MEGTPSVYSLLRCPVVMGKTGHPGWLSLKGNFPLGKNGSTEGTEGTPSSFHLFPRRRGGRLHGIVDGALPAPRGDGAADGALCLGRRAGNAEVSGEDFC